MGQNFATNPMLCMSIPVSFPFVMLFMLEKHQKTFSQEILNINIHLGVEYNYLGGPNSNKKLQEKSFIFQHQVSKHQGQEANFKRKFSDLIRIALVARLVKGYLFLT